MDNKKMSIHRPKILKEKDLKEEKKSEFVAITKSAFTKFFIHLIFQPDYKKTIENTLKQIIETQSRLRELIIYLESVHPGPIPIKSKVATGEQLDMRISIAEKQFPKLELAEMKAAIANGESLTSIYDKIQALFFQALDFQKQIHTIENEFINHLASNKSAEIPKEVKSEKKFTR